MQESARAVLVTPTWLILLMKVAGQTRDVWITPGGRIRPGEQAVSAVVREIHEETGRAGLDVQAEIWVRRGTYLAGGRRLQEQERFFLVPTEQFEPTTAGMERAELERHRGFHWWSILEIAQSPESFVPGRMAELLGDLRHSGPPPEQIETGE